MLFPTAEICSVKPDTETTWSTIPMLYAKANYTGSSQCTDIQAGHAIGSNIMHQIASTYLHVLNTN